MNFISHYYTDRVHPSPFHALGAIIPDLLRISSPKARLFKEIHQFSASNANEEHLKQGIIRHFELDKIFHGSDFFHAHASRLKSEFLKRNLDRAGVKLFFVTHVLTEMLLDRIIILDTPHIGDEFYSTLSEVAPQDTNSFLSQHKEHDMVRFAEHMSGFTSSKYLLKYKEIETIFYAFNRVCKSIGAVAFDPSHFEDFKACVLTTEQEMRADAPGLFLFLKKGII